LLLVITYQFLLLVLP